jgi:glycosyltransferase involved in cell wall biosynthesis
VHGDTTLAATIASYRPTVLRLPGPVSPQAEPQLRAVHAVCANGDALATIKQFLGSHAVELPIGLDINLFSPGRSALRSKFGWTCQDTVVGYVGRLICLKGVDLLASAFRQLSNHLPDARLLIVGSGEEERNIRSIVTKDDGRRILHIERDVSHEQLPEWYRAMDVLVMPSRYENFSNALIEGMSCQIPFIASDIGGNKIVAKTGAGWLFEPGSVASLSERLQTVLGNSAERQRRGNIGSDYVKQHHSWAVTAQCLEDIFTSRLGLTQ